VNPPASATITASVVVATYARPDYVRTCLERLCAQTVAPQRTIVVDASPDDETRAVVAEFPGVEYRRNDHGAGTLATSRAIGIADLSEDVVAFIDDDAFAEPDWLEQILRPYRDAGVGAVGGRALNNQPGEETQGLGQIGLLLPDGRLTGYFAADPGRDLDVHHMLGANMSVRLSAIRAVGGIHDFYPGTCLREDADIGLRIGRAGRRVVYAPKAVVHHVGGTYAKGRRFDSRYHFYGARNHVVLLVTALGWGDPHVRRYLRTAAKQVAHEFGTGLRSLRDPKRESPRAKLRGLAGGIRRGAIDVVGTIVGLGAAVAAAASLRRKR
jgi:GT2 family glycosyltransferase